MTPETLHARGAFVVSLKPQPAYNLDEGAALGRMSIDKTFSGDLNGTSKGEMLTAMGSVKGSAAYVAVERVTGTLNDRKGSFSLHHVGVMDRGQPSLEVRVVPDSGTDELRGLTGTLRIIVEAGAHSYEMDYSITTDA